MRKATKKAARTKTGRKAAVRKGAKAWSAAEIGRLRQLYKTASASRIAKTLKRSESSVKSKARALRLRKPVVKRAASKKRVALRRKAAPRRSAMARRRC
jgi:hypothetical protein